MIAYCEFQDFFKKHGVAVMTIRELFDFIVDPSISDESVDSYLELVRPVYVAFSLPSPCAFFLNFPK